ncbi:hypothetical protein GOP47_0030951, partial [Adiantum capillus-veneris]
GGPPITITCENYDMQEPAGKHWRLVGCMQMPYSAAVIAKAIAGVCWPKSKITPSALILLTCIVFALASTSTSSFLPSAREWSCALSLPYVAAAGRARWLSP